MKTRITPGLTVKFLKEELLPFAAKASELVPLQPQVSLVPSQFL